GGEPCDAYGILVGVGAVETAVDLASDLPFLEDKSLRSPPFIDDGILRRRRGTGGIEAVCVIHAGGVDRAVEQVPRTAGDPVHKRVQFPHQRLDPLGTDSGCNSERHACSICVLVAWCSTGDSTCNSNGHRERPVSGRVLRLGNLDSLLRRDRDADASVCRLMLYHRLLLYHQPAGASPRLLEAV